jgi:hypothetical protein
MLVQSVCSEGDAQRRSEDSVSSKKENVEPYQETGGNYIRKAWQYEEDKEGGLSVRDVRNALKTLN